MGLASNLAALVSKISSAGKLNVSGLNASGTDGQVLTKVGSEWLPQDIPPVGMTLLGTLTTTSNTTHTLSGLNLAPYKELLVVFIGVSFTAGSDVRINGVAATEGSGSNAGALSGHGTINLETGVYIGSASVASTNSLSWRFIYDTGLRNNSTSFTITSSSNAFDAGTIRVYGVR